MHSINDAFDHANHLCGQNNGSNKSQFIGKLHCLVIDDVACTRMASETCKYDRKWVQA